MTCEHITETRDGTVLTLTINRPDKKNALTGAMYAALADGINGAQTDPSVRVILLTGAGDMFTAGNDLMDFMNASPDQVSSETSPTTRFLHSLANAEKPLMAAVNGRAIGVGLTMLLHCDLVYMADDAALQAPFVNLALMPEAASSMLLPATVGRAKANAIFMLGEKIDTNTAEELGIVTAVVPGDALMETAMASAQRLAAQAPGAVRATKALMKTADEPVIDSMAREGALFGERLQSAEVKEAITAFYEKREPDFSQFG